MAIVDPYKGPLARERRRLTDVEVMRPVALGHYAQPAFERATACGTFEHTVDHIGSLQYWQSQRLLKKKPKKLRHLRLYDYGGPFYNRSIRVPAGMPVQLQTKDGSSMWRGVIYAHSDVRNPALALQETRTPPPGTGDDGVPSLVELRPVGASAIAETLPSIPSSSIALTIGELREGLPKIIGLQTK
jgi:hypothetical protein